MKYRLKKGYGSHFVGRKRYVAGDIIDTTRDELRGAIDKFEALEPDPPPPEPITGLTMVKVDGGFDVVNDVSGKVLNDKPLHQHEAEAMGAVAKDDDVDSDEESMATELQTKQAALDEVQINVDEALNAYNELVNQGKDTNDATIALDNAKNKWTNAHNAMSAVVTEGNDEDAR